MLRLFLLVFLTISAQDASAGAFIPATEADFARQRQEMVEEQITARGVNDPQVIDAMLSVPRHEFVPALMKPHAYEDRPLPIGHDQTISQPYIVACMTEAAALSPDDRVLEIGTGSGYQAAVLAELVREVYSIEIVKELAEQSAEKLSKLGYTHVTVRHGDGYQGWKEYAPFDAIIVTAAPPEIPQELVNQLAEGGRMIVPVGTAYQELIRLTKNNGEITQERLLPVRFVPMVRGEE